MSGSQRRSVRPAARATALTASSTGAARSPQMPIRSAASPRKARARSSSRAASPKHSVVSEAAIATRVGSQNRSRQSRPGSVKACRARGASRQAWASSGPAGLVGQQQPDAAQDAVRTEGAATRHPLRFGVRGQRAQQIDARKMARHIVLDEGEDPSIAAVKLGRGAGQQRVDVRARRVRTRWRRNPAAARLPSSAAAGAQPCLALLLVVAQSARGTVRRASRWLCSISSSNWST